MFQRIRPWGTWTKSTVQISDIHKIKPRFARIENFVTTKGSKSLFGFGQKFFVGEKQAEKQVRLPGVWRKLEDYISSEKPDIAKRKK